MDTLGPQDDGAYEDQKEEFQRAAKGAVGPYKSQRAFLQPRRNRVDVDSKIGSVEMINPDAVATTKAHVGEPGSIKVRPSAPLTYFPKPLFYVFFSFVCWFSQGGVTKTGVGWHCKVCDCFLRDSHTYLDHINGKKHQRNLGFSMRVERSTKDQVSSRLAMLAKEKEMQNNPTEDGEENFYDIIKAKDDDVQRRQVERARQRKERRKMKKEMAEQPQSKEEEEDDQQDPSS